MIFDEQDLNSEVIGGLEWQVDKSLIANSTRQYP